jgi:hypothetical protein
VSPVTLPPGRARLATKRPATGSVPLTITIGIAEVAFSAARIAGEDTATIRSTPLRTRSAARSGRRSKSSLAARISNRRSRPSTYPRSRSRWRSSGIPPRADTEDGVR